MAQAAEGRSAGARRAGALQPANAGVAQSVVNRILDLVRTGMLRAGDRLPSERELIDIFGISRPSLREAIRALSMLGVVDTRHGGGAYRHRPRGAHAARAARFLPVAVGIQPRRCVREPAASSRSRSCGRPRPTRPPRTSTSSAACWLPTTSSSPIRSASASSTAASMPACRRSPATSSSSASPMRLYNMGLDIRRRATEDPALIRRSLDEHTAIVRAIEAARPRRGGARHGRPPRPHRGQHPRRDRRGRSRRRRTRAAARRDWAVRGRRLTCRPDAR